MKVNSGGEGQDASAGGRAEVAKAVLDIEGGGAGFGQSGLDHESGRSHQAEKARSILFNSFETLVLTTRALLPRKMRDRRRPELNQAFCVKPKVNIQSHATYAHSFTILSH